MLRQGKQGIEAKAKGVLEAQAKLREAFKNDSDIQVISKHPVSISINSDLLLFL